MIAKRCGVFRSHLGTNALASTFLRAIARIGRALRIDLVCCPLCITCTMDGGTTSDCKFKQLALKAAADLRISDVLKRMQTQNKVFVHDAKSQFTVADNEQLLSAVRAGLGNEGCPTMKNFETYVETLNGYFLHGISGLDCKGKLNKTWVKHNAKTGKSLYTKFVSRERRPARTPPLKKAGLNNHLSNHHSCQ
jgi:hypothetical protein